MLSFIGNGSAFSTGVNTSAYYKTENGTMLLIDCGESVFQELLKKNILDDVKSLVVLITHSHSDHCGSLSGLLWYCEYILKIKISITAPSSVFQILDLMGNHKESYHASIAEDGYSFEVDRIFVTCKKTEHQKGMECFSFLIYIGMYMCHCTFYYSGDTKKLPASVISALRKPDLNLIYCDVTEYDGGDNVHMNIDKLASIVPEKLRSSVYLMHFSDDFNKQKALELGFKITEVE